MEINCDVVLVSRSSVCCKPKKTKKKMGLNKLISMSKSDVLAATDGDRRGRDAAGESEDSFLEQQNQLNVLKSSTQLQQQQQLFGSDFDICKKNGDFGVKKQTLWSSLRIPKKIKGKDDWDSIIHPCVDSRKVKLWNRLSMTARKPFHSDAFRESCFVEDGFVYLRCPFPFVNLTNPVYKPMCVGGKEGRGSVVAFLNYYFY